ESFDDRMRNTIDREYDRSGRRLAIVGHSRGGHYARSLAARYPDRISHIVTMGSGAEDPLDVSVFTRCGAAVVRTALTARDHTRTQRGCLTNRCSCEHAVGFAAPFPDHVRYTSMYSRTDGVVRWQACIADCATCVEVPGSHLGFAF